MTNMSDFWKSIYPKRQRFGGFSKVARRLHCLRVQRSNQQKENKMNTNEEQFANYDEMASCLSGDAEISTETL